MRSSFQTTLAERTFLEGVGVHSGKPVSLVIHPAEADHGIVFLRTDTENDACEIPAHYSHVKDTRLCTVVGHSTRGSVSTIEHLMAAFSGLGIDNALVEVDGPELPIMDGSARTFAQTIEQSGVSILHRVRRRIKILKPVRVESGRAWAELLPFEDGFRLDVEIDFATPLIGRQRKSVHLSPETFRRELSAARTFGFVKDVEKLWSAGLALGSSLENSIALDEDRILNPEGLRWADEFVRHKALDALGDLALAGAPILGRFRSHCGGHALNVRMLEALFADSSAWMFVETAPRRESGHAELNAALAAPAFAPETH